MSEPPDYDSLARRYLDLWQRHLADAAADPDLARAWTTFFAALSGQARPAPFPWPAPFPAAPQAPAGGNARDAAAPGAAPVPAAPGDGGGDLRRLEARLAAVEKRLAELEPRPRGGSRKPKAGPRKRAG